MGTINGARKTPLGGLGYEQKISTYRFYSKINNGAVCSLLLVRIITSDTERTEGKSYCYSETWEFITLWIYIPVIYRAKAIDAERTI